MSRWCGWLVCALFGVGVFMPASARAQAPASVPQVPASPAASQPPQQQQQTGKQKRETKGNSKKSQRELYNELQTPYKQWLSEDVAWIITDKERKAFVELATNEEREQFIEQFWQRRNPDPDSDENSFKEEHYRRIAYVNEHFSDGRPGWLTDRGRIYIMYGTPDEITTHAYGEVWDRPPELGGGETKTYAYDDWTYNYIEGIGNNVMLEFVDDGIDGYRFTTSPSDKDALAHVPGEGLTDAEAMGYSSMKSRYLDMGENPAPMPGYAPAALKEFDNIELEAKLFQAPQVKFKDLEAVVSSRIVRDQLNFSYRFDYMRISDDTDLVPITVQIPNDQLSFVSKDGVHTATLDLFARITTVSGRTVQTFEDTLRRDFPDSLLQQSLKGYAIYQKGVPLRPGLYRLDIVLKDTSSNNVGVVSTRLTVPSIDEEKLAASSLILADSLAPVAAKQIGVGQFVIGSVKVRPKLDQSFGVQQPMGVYMQFYNLKVDPKTQKNNATVELNVTQGDHQVAHIVQTADQIKQNGEQLTVQVMLPLSALAPGKYHLEVKVNDALANQSLARSADFTVTATQGPAPSTQLTSSR